MKYSLKAFKDQTTLKSNVKQQSNYFKTHIVDSFSVTNTTHMAVIPDSLINIEYRTIDLTEMNDSYFKQYFPFILDPFQKIACQSIDYGNNVLVCAHTASGKTLVAEYAIHQAIKKNRKIIYTSPIKALSNQKYHELSNKFNSVGLLTGDTTLNPTADILVMTTEILRNMLYKQNINSYYLIFDEIHYMTDRERGVVWEECIIFSNCPCIFLSATVENAEEFASWVSVTQNRITNIVYNEKRIVPLIHYVFPVGGNGLYRIKGAKPSEYPAQHTESLHLSKEHTQSDIGQDNNTSQAKHQITQKNLDPASSNSSRSHDKHSGGARTLQVSSRKRPKRKKEKNEKNTEQAVNGKNKTSIQVGQEISEQKMEDFNNFKSEKNNGTKIQTTERKSIKKSKTDRYHTDRPKKTQQMKNPPTEAKGGTKPFVGKREVAGRKETKIKLKNRLISGKKDKNEQRGNKIDTPRDSTSGKKEQRGNKIDTSRDVTSGKNEQRGNRIDSPRDSNLGIDTPRAPDIPHISHIPRASDNLNTQSKIKPFSDHVERKESKKLSHIDKIKDISLKADRKSVV